MKLLVFAHIPPPHHGQSYMVKLMLDGFGGGQPGGKSKAETEFSAHQITCYHVNVRVSRELEDIGDFQISKFILLLRYCLQAIWYRFRYGVTTFYYIPAPGKITALYRDWLVMFLCRPFFKKIILHWHAAGLGRWLETNGQTRARELTYRCLKDVDLSIVLSRYNRADAEKFFPRQISVVNNGIPDPCPRFETDVLPRRRARQSARMKLRGGIKLEPSDLEKAEGNPRVFKILYLAHCTRTKGLFDSVEGVFRANEKLAAQGSNISLELTVAGNFFNQAEREEFHLLLASPAGQKSLRYTGFVSGAQKEALLREADCFCFPTYFANENQPVNLIEAMAFGLPILTSRWHSIPELLPPNYNHLVDIQSPDQIAEVLLDCMTGETAEIFREIFLRNFKLQQFLATLAQAMRETETANLPSTIPRRAVNAPVR